jgi:hypothetical protein
MKKIILAIFTITLMLAIFGCGKMQQARGGGNNGSGNPTTFTISGEAQVPNSIDDTLYASWPERLGRYLAGVFIPQVYAADFGFKPLKKADVKIFEFGADTVVMTAKTGDDGRYTVSLPLGKIYIVVVEKAASDGSATINIKNVAHEESPKVDVTPVTSVAVEAISQNAAAREALVAVNSGSGDDKPDVSTVVNLVTDIKKKVENYYETHQNEIDSVDVTAPTPPSVPNNLYTIATGTKIIDGNPSDWTSDYSIVFEDTNKEDWEGNPRAKYAGIPGLKIKSIKVAKDAENLYFLWEAVDGFSNDPRYGYSFFIQPRTQSNVDHKNIKVVMWKYGQVDGNYPAWFGDNSDTSNDGYFTRAGYEANNEGNPFNFLENGRVVGNFYETAVSINYIKEKLGDLLDPVYDNLYEIWPNVSLWGMNDNNNGWWHNDCSNFSLMSVEKFHD